tara:strand:+ start:5812 stop:6837 length:1026 start_codon:yes stop_codon:yes gene_type:complete
MALLLPGLIEGDEIEVVDKSKDTEDFECLLTLETDKSFDCHAFLKEMHQSNHQDETEKKRARCVRTIKQCIESVPREVRIIRLSKCGHCFLEVPFLYHVMTTEFKCPVCRSGSSSVIDIGEKEIENMNENTWNCLCRISKQTRDRRKMEDAVEEMHSLMELQLIEVQNINSMSVAELLTEIQITVIFSVYNVVPNTAAGYRGVSPSANVTVQLRPNFMLSFSAEESMDGENCPMVYESGHAQRPLSLILRSCAAFSFTLFAQSDDGEFAFFQSGVLHIPDQERVERDPNVVISCTSGLNGQVVMRWDASAANCLLLRGIRYQTDVANARRIRLHTLNGFTL